MEERGSQGDAPGGAAAVFVSYASVDAALAQTVVAELERNGISCWIAPRDVVPGEFYAGAIVHAIDAANAIVLVLSEHAASSQHILREVERASSKRLPIVTLRIDRAAMPAEMEYFLNTSHWLDASTTGVERALPKLVEAARRAISGDAASLAASRRSPGLPSDAVGARVARRTRMRPGVVAIAVAVMLVLAFAGAAMYMRWTGARATHAQTAQPVVASAVPASPEVPEASIAVLPFVDMSEKKDEEYFSDGLSEELINMLVKVQGLRVPARTSSFYFKGKTTTIARIAEELRVSNVLEGSVRKSGNRLRITVQLVRASTGYHLWSETYDRRISDIFRIQEDISKSVVDALKVSLLPSESPAAVSRPSSDVYTLFLQARALIATHGTPETETAAGYLRRALEIDPKYAPAWALYVKTRTMLLDADAIPYRRAHDEAIDAARRAIAADPSLGAAHMAMVRFHIYFDWDWIAMADEVATARRLDPRDADTLRYAGSLALTLGRAEEAVSLFQRAGDLDPLDGANYILLGRAELALGRLAAARQAFQRSVELHPHLGAQFMLGEVARLSGDPAAALAIFEHEPGEDDRLFGEALTLRSLGRGAEADAALATLESKFANADAYAIGCVYVVRGETDRAFAWLSRAYDQHDQSLTSLKSDPILKAISGDARFAALLHKMKLPE